MIEFGNQETHDKKGVFYSLHVEEGFFTTTFSTKYFFQHLGLHHTSVDLNQWDGSVALDCRQDISKKLSRADVITNIGFSEHVGEGDMSDKVVLNQYMFFKNMHELGKVGALFYHDFIVNFYRHGVVNYDVDFIYALQEKSNYTLVMEPYQNPIAAVGDDGNEIITYLAAFRKVNDDPFMNFEEFETLPGLRNIIYQYGRYRRVAVDIFAPMALDHKRVPVFEINQDLGEEKTFQEWAEFFCNKYFTTTSQEDNLFLKNSLDIQKCNWLTWYTLNASSIEHSIRD